MSAVLASRGVTIVLPGQTPAGEHILGVLLKRSYDIVPNAPCTRAEEDRALVPGDVFWDSPMNSAVRYESDFVPFKLGTDVILNGFVHAPGGRPTQACQAALHVADRSKKIGVFGDRVAHHAGGSTPVFGEPQAFETMELRYERAYGGTDVAFDPDTPYPYAPNPLGKGFVIANAPAGVEGLTLPNFEDPADLLTPERLCIGEFAQWNQQPFPMGLGWYPKAWFARAQYAGILPGDRATEQELRQAYGQLVPADQREAYMRHKLPDMDFRFFQGAARGLAMPYLQGGENVLAENLSPGGRLAFRLPTDTPRLALDIGQGPQAPETVMHTVMIHMEERQLDIVWRIAVPYPGRDWLPQMRKMEVAVQ